MAGQLCEDKSPSGGFCYSDVSSENQAMQGFVSDPEMFNLTTGMEMIGFSKQQQQQQSDHQGAMWRAHGSQQHAPSSSATLYQYNNKPDFTWAISETAPWQQDKRSLVVDDSSSVRCVFPCEGNERPSQGLSLSLSSNNPSSIGLQSFELRQTASNMITYQGHFVLKNSKYLLPAQELLNEFCSLATTRHSDAAKNKSHKNKQWEEEDTNIATSSSKKHTLTSLEFAELHKRKTKLLAMLEEVERRYRNYRSQMKAVAASFEEVAGNGAGTVYSAMALKAMSRHCKRLKDGILGQIQVTRKAMGEKDPVAPGTTRGETPRLKIIDQALRQQRAFQQMSMMETHPWRPQRGLPERSVSVLRAWLFEHFLHPYPSDVDKHILARQTGLSRSQVSNWFINARVRLWKPMVEEMYVEEVKEHENNMVTNTNSSDGGGTELDEDNINFQNPSDPSPRPEDQKPTPDRLLRMMDSECASSSMLLNQDNKNNPQEPHCLGDTFGSVELDFSTYAHHQQGVSLTLGLQQHGGVSLAAFPPDHHATSAAAALFYPITRGHQIEDCDQGSSVQYSLLDAEAQNLPYRNLMGAQLLHDLAG